MNSVKATNIMKNTLISSYSEDKHKKFSEEPINASESENEARAANIIKNALISSYSQDSYKKLSAGLLGIAFNFNDRKSLASMIHMKSSRIRRFLFYLSGESCQNESIKRINAATGMRPIDFFLHISEKILNYGCYLVHASNNDCVNENGTLCLFSYDKLLLKTSGGKLGMASSELDRSLLANSGFIFFSLEFGGKQKKHGSRFGSHAYRIPLSAIGNKKSAMLWIRDVLENHGSARYRVNRISKNFAFSKELTWEFAKMMPITQEGRYIMPKNLIMTSQEDIIFGENFITDLLAYISAAIYNVASKDASFKEDIINLILKIKHSDNEEDFDHLINSLFRPQVLIPQSLCTKNFELVRIELSTT